MSRVGKEGVLGCLLCGLRPCLCLSDRVLMPVMDGKCANTTSKKGGPDTVAHTFNPRTQKAESSMSLKSGWSIYQISGQLGLHGETLS